MNLEKEAKQAVFRDLQETKYEIQCPKCGLLVQVAPGKGACPRCSEEIDLQVTLDMDFKVV